MGLDQCCNVEIGIVVNLRILRSVLKGLSANGRRWWIACDLRDAMENGAVTVGFGDPRCRDPLNRAFFQVPVVQEPSSGTPDGLLLLLDPSTIVSGDVGEFDEFWAPLKEKLISRLRGGD